MNTTNKTLGIFVAAVVYFAFATIAWAQHRPTLREWLSMVPGPRVDESTLRDAREHPGDQERSTRRETSGTECIRTTGHHVTMQSEEVVAFNPNAGLLWPGALVQSRNATTGVLEGVTVRSDQRTPIVVTLSEVASTAEGLAPPAIASRRIMHPAMASAEQARLQLISSGFHPIAGIAYTERDVYTFDQGLISIGVKASWVSGGLRGQLDTGSSTSQSSVIVSFVQRYYTLSIDPPPAPDAFFTHGVTPRQLSIYANPVTNPIGYIASVTYGRRVLLIASSSESRSSLHAVMDASANAIASNVDIHLSEEQQRVLRGSTIRYVAIGGDPTPTVAVIGHPAEELIPRLRALLAAPTSQTAIRFGLPISYRINYLRDNTVMSVADATDYEVSNRSPRPFLHNPHVVFHTTSEDKEPSTNLFVTISTSESEVNGPNDRTYASWRQTTPDGFVCNTDRDLMLDGNVPVSSLASSSAFLHVCITPDGRDSWHFNVHVRSDGYSHDILEQELHSAGSHLVCRHFPLARMQDICP